MEFYVVVLQWRQKSELKSVKYVVVCVIENSFVDAVYLLARRKNKSKKARETKMSNVPNSLEATRLSPH